MDRIKSRIKGVFGFFWRYKLRSVCVLLALFIALSGVHYYKSGKAGNATVSFNYSEASQGLNPNKTRFSFSEIISDEVLERGIWLAGLEDCITPAQLSAHIGISPVDTGNAGGDDEYISTTYRVSLSVDGLEMKNRTAAVSVLRHEHWAPVRFLCPKSAKLSRVASAAAKRSAA